jgi:hypothetical protein
MSRSNGRRAPRSESLADFAMRAGVTQSSASSISITRAAALVVSLSCPIMWAYRTHFPVDQLHRDISIENCFAADPQAST